jgi:hypothetical protein
MADERIEVEWIATATRMTQILDKIDTRLDKQDAKLDKIGKTSEKAAEAAAGSFNHMEAELKQAEAALNKLTVGTAAFAAQKAKVDGLRTSLAQARTSLQQAPSGMTAALNAGMTKLTSFAAGFVGLQQAVSAVVNELNRVREIKIAAAGTARTFEEALTEAAPNLMAQGPQAVMQTREMALQAAPQLGADPGKIVTAMAQAISAGATDLAQALSVAEAAITLTAGNVEEALPLIGGALDVARAGKTTDFKAALGQLLQTQSESRGVNIRDFVTNIGPGLAAAAADMPRQNAVSTERALELAGTISTILSDPTMANTATTMRMLFTRLGTFTPQREVKLEDNSIARVTEPQIEAFNKLRSFDERMQMMADVPAIGQQFLETQRESIGKVAIQQIIEQQATAMALLKKAEAAVTPLADAAPAFEALKKQTTEATPLLTTTRRAEAERTVATLREPQRSFEGQMFDVMDKALSEVELSGFDAARKLLARSMVELRQGTGESVAKATIEELRMLQQNVLFGGQTSLDTGNRLAAAIDAIQKLERDRREAERQQPPGVLRVNVQAPAARPKEAPLPAATAP